MLLLEVFLQFHIDFQHFLECFQAVSVKFQGCYEYFKTVFGVEIVSYVFVSQQCGLELGRLFQSEVMEAVLSLCDLGVDSGWCLVLPAKEEVNDKIEVFFALEQFGVAHDFLDTLIQLNIFNCKFSKFVYVLVLRVQSLGLLQILQGQLIVLLASEGLAAAHKAFEAEVSLLSEAIIENLVVFDQPGAIIDDTREILKLEPGQGPVGVQGKQVFFEFKCVRVVFIGGFIEALLECLVAFDLELFGLLEVAHPPLLAVVHVGLHGPEVGVVPGQNGLALILRVLLALELVPLPVVGARLAVEHRLRLLPTLPLVYALLLPTLAVLKLLQLTPKLIDAILRIVYVWNILERAGMFLPPRGWSAFRSACIWVPQYCTQ